jgi:hypothetical protein
MCRYPKYNTRERRVQILNVESASVEGINETHGV